MNENKQTFDTDHFPVFSGAAAAGGEAEQSAVSKEPPARFTFKDARVIKHHTNPLYEGDIVFGATFLVFCLLVYCTWKMTKKYPDKRRDQNLEFVAFLKHDNAVGGVEEGVKEPASQSKPSSCVAVQIENSDTSSASISTSQEAGSRSTTSTRQRKSSLTNAPGVPASGARPVSSLATETYSLSTATDADAKLNKKPSDKDKEKKN